MIKTDVNDIIDTMDSKDKHFLGIHDGDKYQSTDEDQKLVKRIVKKIGGIPVSFFDVTGDSTGVAITIGTRSGGEYRNKGHATAVAEQGKKWLKAHADEFDRIVWWVRKDNIPSIKTAKSIGFELDEASVLPDDPWIKYQFCE